ncbi:MAG: hypothetical protein BA066_02565 [Candidatus Korarchaeota archaeon NZ13-K]|nr:MAG: hypothetical protein BA066_02565 [Candidatus Korarchaeota archaeon NZ13-K]
MNELLIVLDHHALGYISLWYGAATLLTGVSLLLAQRKPLLRKIRYLRLIHTLLGIATSIMGLLTYIATL